MSTAQRALRGTLFVAANSYLSIFIAFVSGVILARLLNPADFGVYRLALFFADLFGRVSEFGLDKALIHKQDNLEVAYKTHFTLQVSLSILALVLALVFAPVIISRYSPLTFAFIVVISVGYVFQALGYTQRLSLEKNLLFSHTALVDIISLILSSAISVFMAFRGYGPLSLVVGYGANYVFSFCLFWLIHPWKVSFKEAFLFDTREIKWFLRFGSFLFIGGLTTFILYRYNDFILGTFLSAAALGFYSRAFNYAQIPTSLITSVVSKVALPTYSALQNDREKLSAAFSIVLKSIVRISFPLSLILYLVADDFTVFLLGPKWLPMVPIFRILLIYGVFRSIFDDLGELFTAVGKPNYVSFYLLVQALISLALVPILTHFYKAEGAATSLSLVLVFGVLVAYFLLYKTIKINTLSVFLPTTVVCFLTMISFKFFLAHAPLTYPNLFVSLAVKGLVFGFFYVIYMLVLDGRSFFNDLNFVLNHWRGEAAPVEELAEEEKNINKTY
ncbi:MAG: lipopolysaccharide biosynthesis protein [Patescibacteria group bacterium]|nr:lipopolysaccharide biosynthesis protein [Patescibacteria group bacterium]